MSEIEKKNGNEISPEDIAGTRSEIAENLETSDKPPSDKWMDLLYAEEGKIKIGGNLDLRDFVWLTVLPDGLEVDGDVWLDYCTDLKSLSERLTVKGDLYLVGCTGLTSLPQGLSVGGILYLSKDSHEQVKKDAEKLKEEGKVAALQFANYTRRGRYPHRSTT